MSTSIHLLLIWNPSDLIMGNVPTKSFSAVSMELLFLEFRKYVESEKPTIINWENAIDETWQCIKDGDNCPWSPFSFIDRIFYEEIDLRIK